MPSAVEGKAAAMSSTALRKDGRGSRAKNVLSGLLLTTITLSLILVGAEIATRLFSDAGPPLKAKNDTFGDHYLPSFSGDVYVNEAGRKIHLRFNKHGFRGPDRPKEKPPGVRRIAVLGDSMIASMAVEEPHTLVHRLESMLNEASGKGTWEAFNFGVSAASPGTELVVYRELASQWHPDLVLVAFFVGNDISDSSRELDNYPRIYFDIDEEGRLYQRPFSAGRASLSNYLNRYSRFYVWQKERINEALHRARATAQVLSPCHWAYCRQESDEIRKAWEIIEGVFRMFRQEVETNGGRLAVIILPNGYQVYPDQLEKLLALAGERSGRFDADYPVERLTGICRELEIPVLSLAGSFRLEAGGFTARETPSRDLLLFGGGGHLTKAGNALAAGEVYLFLQEQLDGLQQAGSS
jgi:hypothetical protein